jgi:ketosteroid isomerase-like protein
MNRASAFIAIAVIMISSAVLFGASRRAKSSSSKFVSQSDDQSMEREVVSKEREGLEALKASAPQRLADLTADDAIFVDAHGPASKAQVAENVIGFTLTEYTMDDVHFVRISPDTGLITYKLSEKGNSHGREFTAQAYVSSVWTHRDGKRVCLFSQETAAR